VTDVGNKKPFLILNELILALKDVSALIGKSSMSSPSLPPPQKKEEIVWLIL